MARPESSTGVDSVSATPFEDSGRATGLEATTHMAEAMDTEKSTDGRRLRFPAALTVRELMVPDPIRVSPHMAMQDAMRLMAARNIGALLISEGDQVVGIFTERDLMRVAATAPHGWRQWPVGDWMTQNPWTIGPEATWDQALSLVETLLIRHIPVVENERIVGIVTARDLITRHGEFLSHAVDERTRELREANERLQERDRELRVHMAMAGKIQARLLPRKLPQWPEVEWAAHYEPLDELGGDYYGFARPDPHHLGVLIADATGHSIPAAMVAIMARSVFATVTQEVSRPAEVLEEMNRQLHGLTEEHFVTAFYGLLERETRHFTYASAGHPYPFRYSCKTQECQPLAAIGLMLGIERDVRYEEQEVQLQHDDRLLLYTDGLSEGQGPEGAFGKVRIGRFLAENCGQGSAQPVAQPAAQPAAALVQRLADRLADFRGNEPATDDVTIVAAVVR